MRFKTLLILAFSFSTLAVFSQSKFTISGYVKDSESGEDLIGAVIFNSQNNSQASITNIYGFYSLTLPQGNYKIKYQYIGYKAQELEVNLTDNKRMNINLVPEGSKIEEIVITVERTDENVKSTDMGKIDVDIEQVKTLPVVFGEIDILKTIQLLPGVQSSGEGNTGFYVRGGGADQNLVLLDEAVVYNPGHLFGFFSVFNADAIKNATLIKGGMPANYGGRLSSVLDVSMKEGNDKKYRAEGGIGIISSRLLFEGPIVKNKSSFMITGRRTYIDAVTKPFLKNSTLGGIPYYFYDLNLKANYRFSDKDRIYLSGYFGRDVANFKNLFGGKVSFKMDWGNATSTLRWNHLFNDKLFMNVSTIFNAYDFSIDAKFEDITTSYKSAITDYNAKIDFYYIPNVRHAIKYGANYTYHIFNPRTLEFQTQNETFNADNVKKKYAHEAAIYAMDEFKVTDKLMINYGLRGTFFAHMGPFSLFQFTEYGFIDTSGTQVFQKGEVVDYDFGIEPRLSLRYTLDNTSSIKAGYSYNHQYVHLVSNSYTSIPLDIWVPSSVLVAPQVSQQISVGYFRNFKENTYETSVELYYKTLDNQIEYDESYVLDAINKDIEYEFVFGRGWSYGAEFFVKKRLGDLTGWIGYTLSKTERQFPDLNEGKIFPARFDRRHDLSVVASYELNKKWTFSSTFVYGTGQASTMPEQFYIVENNVAKKYGPRNGFRMEAYHRLDLSVVRNSKFLKKYESSWVFSVYNAYNRKNPFFYYIDTKFDQNEGIQNTVYKVYIFPILPSITWNFKF